MKTYMRAVAKGLSVMVAVVALHACGGGGGDGSSPPPATPTPTPTVTAPSALSYTSPQTYTVGTAITALTPTVTGTPTSYSVSPALPAGLSIDAGTGAISGTPSAAAATAAYTITASNAGGSTTFPLSITVNAPATAPPSGLTYASPQSYTVGTAITALTPTVTGTVASYAVAPGLPAGLAIDATSGVISGTPTAPSAATPYTITATNAAGSTTFALTLSTGLQRATADRPDKPEKKDLDQIHVMYVVPSDAGYDQHLDTLGTIEASVKNWSNWFSGPNGTGGPKLRLDTFGDGDNLDVTFLQLSRSDADLSSTAGNVRTKIEFALLAAGFDATNKVYLVYYEGDGDGCASGAWPPAIHGTVSVLYLRGKVNPDCPAATLVGANDPSGYWEVRAVHEILHPLGFAPACSPHTVGNGHLADSNRELLFNGTLSLTPTLDVNHDDYYTAAVPNCFDLMNSAYLDPKPAGAEEPPNHPYVNLTSAACSTELTIAPQPSATDTTITFVNNYAPGGAGAALSVSELVVGASGNTRTNVNTLPFGEGLTLNSATNTKPKVGTVYVVSVGGVGGTCQAIVTATANPSRFVVKATTP